MSRYRQSVKTTLDDMGFDSVDAAIEAGALSDSIVPACCTEGCEVEPDGCCEHGCPSILVALGVI